MVLTPLGVWCVNMTWEAWKFKSGIPHSLLQHSPMVKLLKLQRPNSEQRATLTHSHLKTDLLIFPISLLYSSVLFANHQISLQKELSVMGLKFYTHVTQSYHQSDQLRCQTWFTAQKADHVMCFVTSQY